MYFTLAFTTLALGAFHASAETTTKFTAYNYDQNNCAPENLKVTWTGAVGECYNQDNIDNMKYPDASMKFGYNPDTLLYYIDEYHNDRQCSGDVNLYVYSEKFDDCINYTDLDGNARSFKFMAESDSVQTGCKSGCVDGTESPQTTTESPPTGTESPPATDRSPPATDRSPNPASQSTFSILAFTVAIVSFMFY